MLRIARITILLFLGLATALLPTPGSGVPPPAVHAAPRPEDALLNDGRPALDHATPAPLAPALSPPLTDVMCGDLTADNLIGLADVIVMLQITIGLIRPTAAQNAAGDLNRSGVVDVADAVIALLHVVGFKPINGCGAPPVTIVRTSPIHGEGMVAVTRETVIEFDRALDPASVTSEGIRASFGGRPLSASRRVSNGGKTVTLFYDPPLPPSARIRISVNGGKLLDAAGFPVDADGDGIGGGIATIDFDTLSLTRIPNTNVFGFVFDSYTKNPDGSDIPVVGATIRVDAFPEANAVTDATGRFEFRDMPAPVFFVHVDGSTAQAPPGKVYATVGKPFHSIAGQTTQLFMDGLPFHIYLPTMDAGDIVPLSPTQDTEVGFGDAGKAELVRMFPDMDPSVWERTKVVFPPNSAVDKDGVPATEAAIIPVPSERLPAPLPPGINHQLDIAVMAPGATNFDVPAPACFPNLPDPVTRQPPPPGAPSALMSFNHDTGRWEVVGPMTVSADGQLVCTDPGVGILAPGWHGTTASAGARGGETRSGSTSDNDSEPGTDDSPPACPGGCQSNPCNCPAARGGSQSNKSDPVYYFSGEFYHAEEDLRIPGRGIDFVWSRKYRSKTGPNTAQGNGWDFAYNIRIEASGQDRVLFDGNTRRDTYRLQPDGNWMRKEFFQRLAQNEDGSYTLKFDDGGEWGFNKLNGSISSGKLASIADRNGNRQTFGYDAEGRLTRITDTYGRHIEIGYNADGFIATVTDFIGRTVRYEYYDGTEPGGSFGDLKSVTLPAVVGTPTGNDFPRGKTTTYTYSRGFSDDRLNHNMLTITDPNGQTYLVNIYAATTNPQDINFDRVVRQVWGDPTDIIDMVYTPLAPTKDNNMAVMQTIVNDRNGNVTEYFYDAGNRLVILRQFTGRADPGQPTTRITNRPKGKLRSTDPPFFGTRFEWNSDSLMMRSINPEGNITEYVFESDLNPAAPARSRGNVRRITSIPDPRRGGDQAQLVNSFTYEPIYNQIRTMTDPRGHDPSFRPPVQLPDEVYPNPARYTTVYTFDYEEGCDFAAIGAKVGISAAQAQQLLVAARMCAAPLGDVNGDGLTNQVAGNIIRAQFPSIHLLPGSNQAAIEGDTVQPIVALATYNQFGQTLSSTDPEGNVDIYEYYPENDPDGDGEDLIAGRGDGPFGYLRQITRDAVSAPGRNSGENPPPTNIRHLFHYDQVGNLVREVSPRGIATDFVVNELNQVVQLVRAAAHDVFVTDPAEPLPLTDFQYLERSFYDANNNVVRRQIEDRGNTSNVRGDNGDSGTAFVDIEYKYDILNNLIEMREEVNDSEVLVTRYRYDPNRNQVLEIYPEGNAAASIYDERDLLFQSIRGATSPPPLARLFPDDPRDYDVRGGLASTLTFHYDRNGNLIESVDAADTDGSAANNSDRGGAGERTRYIYDGFDRQTSVVDAVRNQTVYQYDAAGDMVRRLSFGPVGGASPTSDGPDALPMPVSVAGVVQTKNLVNASLLSAAEMMHDELGRVFQADGLLFVNTTPTVRPPDVADGAADIGKDNLTPGDSQGVPGIAGINVIGQVTARAEYDRNSRATFMVEDDGDTSRTLYDGAGRVTRVIDAEGNSVEMAYDDVGNVIETRTTDVSQAHGVRDEVFLTTYFYDSLNRLQRLVDNVGQTSEYRYDSRNNLVTLTDAQGPLTGASIARRAFSGGALTTNAINDSGNVTRYFYDGIGRLVRREAILTPSGQGDGINIGADIFGVKTAIPTPDPTQGGGDGIIRVGNTYDRNSLLSASLDDQGNVTLYLYDNLDRRVTETRGITANTTPLDKARILGTREIVTPIVATINSPAVIPTARIDAQLAAARARLDALAALFPPLADQVDDNPPTTMAYGFDQDNNLLILEDENDSEVFTRFDAVNRPIAVRVFRSGQADSHAGDPVFAPAPVEDRSNPSTAFSAIVGTTKQDFQYDGLSRATRATDNNKPDDASDDSIITYAYDSLSRQIETAQQIGSLPTRAISTSWRATGLRSSLTYPNGRVLERAYDLLDRQNTVGDQGAAQPIADYDYIGPGRIVQRRYPINGTRLTLLDDAGTADVGYDGISRPVQLRHLRSNNTLIVGFGHTYDRMNNKRIEEKLHAREDSELYRYDSLYRLIQFDRGTLNVARDSITTPSPNQPLQREWKLDGVGNWQQVVGSQSGAPFTETRRHSSFNEITVQDSGVPVDVLSDDGGNEVADGRFLFQWDFSGRLRAVARKADSALVATYSYDASGRRIRKLVTNSGALDGTTNFYYDGWREIEERDGADALVQQYVYGIGIDEPLVIDRNLDGDDSTTGPADRRLFYHQNTLGSVFALTDATGAVVEGYQYDAYGRQTVFNPGGNGIVDFGGDDVVTVGGTSSQGNPFLFTGRRLDAETGLYYFRLRYLNAEQGRFVSRDPLGTWNDSLGSAYTYAEGNPINRIDPYGLDSYFGDVVTTFGGYLKGMGGALKGVGEFFYYTGAGIGSDFADLVDPNGKVFDLNDRKYYQKKRDQIVDGIADLIYDPRGTAARWRDEKIKALANALESGDLSKAGEVLGGAATEAGLAVDAAVKLPSAGVQIGRATVQAGQATARLTRATAQSVQRATSRIRAAINRMQCRAARSGFPTRAALNRQLAIRDAINVANQAAAIFDEAIKALKKNKISPEEMDFILKNLDEIANRTLDDMIKPNEVPGMVRDGFIKPGGTPEPNPLFRAVWDEAAGAYRIIEDNAPGATSSPPASPTASTVTNAPAVSPNASAVASPAGGATSGAGPGSTVTSGGIYVGDIWQSNFQGFR